MDNNLAGQINSQSDKSVGDDNRGKIDIHGNKPEYTISYINFLVKTNDGSKSQKVNVRKYPAIYSLNVESTGTLNQWQNKRLYTIQHSVTKSSNTYSVAKPSDKNDNTVSPAFIIASTINSRLQSIGSNDEAKKYCEQYKEKAKTRKGEDLDLSGWRLPTKEEVKKLLVYNQAITLFLMICYKVNPTGHSMAISLKTKQRLLQGSLCSLRT